MVFSSFFFSLSVTCNIQNSDEILSPCWRVQSLVDSADQPFKKPLVDTFGQGTNSVSHLLKPITCFDSFFFCGKMILGRISGNYWMIKWSIISHLIFVLSFLNILVANFDSWLEEAFHQITLIDSKQVGNFPDFVQTVNFSLFLTNRFVKKNSSVG